MLALDTEFPGFLREEPPFAARAVRYQALRENCDLLRPIQLGVSVSSRDGILFGTWCFNLCFDIAIDLYTEAAVTFLIAAGVDFPRHATEGIDPATFGRKFAASTLVGGQGCRPNWVTFQGWYDFGYILKLLTGWPLPEDVVAFDVMLTAFFPQRFELRDALPRGSLSVLSFDNGVERMGTPHTAGSDALATLELFLQVDLEEGGFQKKASFASKSRHFHPAGARKSATEDWNPACTQMTNFEAMDYSNLEALEEMFNWEAQGMEFVVTDPSSHGQGWEVVSAAALPQQLHAHGIQIHPAQLMQALQAAQAVLGPMQVQCVHLHVQNSDPSADTGFQIAECHDHQGSANHCHLRNGGWDASNRWPGQQSGGHSQHHNMMWPMPMTHMAELTTVPAG